MVTVFPSLRSLKAQTWRQIHGSSLRINGQVRMVPARTIRRMAETFSSDVDVEKIEDQIMVFRVGRNQEISAPFKTRYVCWIETCRKPFFSPQSHSFLKLSKWIQVEAGRKSSSIGSCIASTSRLLIIFVQDSIGRARRSPFASKDLQTWQWRMILIIAFRMITYVTYEWSLMLMDLFQQCFFWLAPPEWQDEINLEWDMWIIKERAGNHMRPLNPNSNGNDQ